MGGPMWETTCCTAVRGFWQVGLRWRIFLSFGKEKKRHVQGAGILQRWEDHGRPWKVWSESNIVEPCYPRTARTCGHRSPATDSGKKKTRWVAAAHGYIQHGLMIFLECVRSGLKIWRSSWKAYVTSIAAEQQVGKLYVPSWRFLFAFHLRKCLQRHFASLCAPIGGHQCCLKQISRSNWWSKQRIRAGLREPIHLIKRNKKQVFLVFF